MLPCTIPYSFCPFRSHSHTHRARPRPDIHIYIYIYPCFVLSDPASLWTVMGSSSSLKSSLEVIQTFYGREQWELNASNLIRILNILKRRENFIWSSSCRWDRSLALRVPRVFRIGAVRILYLIIWGQRFSLSWNGKFHAQSAFSFQRYQVGMHERVKGSLKVPWQQQLPYKREVSTKTLGSLSQLNLSWSWLGNVDLLFGCPQISTWSGLPMIFTFNTGIVRLYFN